MRLRQCYCFPIRLYQLFIKPVLPACCRFYPSCSHYAIQCFLTHGFMSGSYLIVRRLLRCHPWSDGGNDPVPTNLTQLKRGK